ncbi:glycosyltransferase family 2 protein [Ilumatobacter sp.]|uniref:glycosyltransferase family 2 protein n=1 Tax=Ilumatobacter sp. TaxID=1967498 RepID=UPI003B52AF71
MNRRTYHDAPTVSVVIPCYNYERYIGDAIASVMASCSPADEVIVVDDGSTDGSAAVVERFGDAVTLVRKSNGGMASALNRGVAQATSDVVAFLDADDLMGPGRLGWIRASFRGPGVVMAWHPLTIFDDRGAEHGTCPATPLPGGDLVPRILDGRFSSFAVTSGIAVRRETALDVGPIPEGNFRDAAEGFLVRAVPFHGEVASTTEPLGRYRSHSGSASRRHESPDIADVALKLEQRLVAARREHELLSCRAVASGHRLSTSMLRSRDTPYVDMAVAVERLRAETRSEAWRRSAEIDARGCGAWHRARLLARRAIYVGAPRQLVARHHIVRGGASDLRGGLRIWSALYWNTSAAVERARRTVRPEDDRAPAS